MFLSTAFALIGLSPPGDDLRINCTTSFDQAETSIRVDPNDPDHIVAVAIDWSGGAQGIGWYTTLDGGATWSCGFLRASGFSGAADPDVVFDVNGGVHVFLLHVFGPGGNAIYVHHSTDGGVTFPSRTLIELNPGVDKPLATVITAPGPHHGRIVVTWHANGRVFVATSDDDGATWSAPVQVNEPNSLGRLNCMFSDVAVGPAGEVFAIWFEFDFTQVMFDVSLDGGSTWGTDGVVETITMPPSGLPGFQFDLKPVFALAADATASPYSGNAYVAFHTWNTSGPTAHADVKCAMSSDHGLTWSSTIVHPGDSLPTDQCMPSVAVDGMGGVEVTWLDRRTSGGGSELELWGARSLDAGATFEERPLSDAGFDPADAGNSGTFIGHYESLDAGESYAYACWSDARSGADFLDVWLDLWQLDLATDATTISAGTGGVAHVAITPGPLLGSAGYLLLGSASGRDPGLDFGPVHLALNWDAFTIATIVSANGAMLQQTLGSLDLTGSAKATLDSLGPIDPSLVGTKLDFAAVFFDPLSGRIAHASAPITIVIVP